MSTAILPTLSKKITLQEENRFDIQEKAIFTAIFLGIPCAIGLFFFFGLLFSLRKYDKLSWFQTIKQSLETCFYMLFMWTPLVTFIVFKILLFKRDMNWGKTSHGLSQNTKKEQIKKEEEQQQEE